jgi:hypothetical protein
MTGTTVGRIRNLIYIHTDNHVTDYAKWGYLITNPTTLFSRLNRINQVRGEGESEVRELLIGEVAKFLQSSADEYSVGHLFNINDFELDIESYSPED